MTYAVFELGIICNNIFYFVIFESNFFKHKNDYNKF